MWINLWHEHKSLTNCRQNIGLRCYHLKIWIFALQNIDTLKCQHIICTRIVKEDPPTAIDASRRQTKQWHGWIWALGYVTSLPKGGSHAGVSRNAYQTYWGSPTLQPSFNACLPVPCAAHVLRTFSARASELFRWDSAEREINVQSPLPSPCNSSCGKKTFIKVTVSLDKKILAASLVSSSCLRGWNPLTGSFSSREELEDPLIVVASQCTAQWSN